MWLRQQLQSARGDAPEGNVMTKRIEIDDMNLNVERVSWQRGRGAGVKDTQDMRGAAEDIRRVMEAK